MLGILVINIESFAYPDPWSPYKFGFASPIDHDIRFWVYFLAQGKFYSMFTLLFGVSFFLFFRRAESKVGGSEALLLLSRRLLGLFLIGFLHAYLIWDGDVLYHYAVCGLLLIPFEFMSNRKLLYVVLVMMIPILYNSYSLTNRNQIRYSAYEEAIKYDSTEWSNEQKNAVQTWIRMTTPGIPDTTAHKSERQSYIDSVAINADHSKLHRGNILYPGLVFRTLFMMILGMMLARVGVFSDISRIKFYWVWTALTLLFALAINYWRYFNWTYTYYQPTLSIAESLLTAFSKESFGLAYILLFNGVFQKLEKRYSFSWIRAVGRMALTNYILQSIICAVIFYGFTLDHYNRWSRSELLVFIPAIWLLNILISTLWLRRFQQGPLEAVWRRFTYLK